MCKVNKYQFNSNRCTNAKTPNYLVNQCLNPVSSINLDTLGFGVVSNKGGIKSKEGLSKAIRKAKSFELAEELCQLDSPLKKQYQRTLTCSQYIKQEGNKLTSSCCRGRWCLLCLGKRTRELISGYVPYLKSVKDRDIKSLTLTIKTISAGDLRKTIRHMNTSFARIMRRARNKGNKIDAIKNIEVTYTKKNDKYHPHFHILVIGSDNAEYILQEWLKTYPTYLVNRAGQHIRDLQNEGKTMERSLVEFFKYVTKTNKEETPIEAMDVIFQSVQGIQLIQTYGNIKKIEEQELSEEQITDVPYNEFAMWQWIQEHRDWINMSDGTMLVSKKNLWDMDIGIPPNPN